MSAQSRKLSIESMEARQLMTATPGLAAEPVPQAFVEQGTLIVSGSEAAEQISVQRQGRDVQVRVVDQTTGEVSLEETFSRRQIRSLEIDAQGGDDRVINGTRFPAVIHGGEGDDGLYSRGVAELYGDAGSDRFLMAGDDQTAADQETHELQIHLHDGQRTKVDFGDGRGGQWGRGRFAAQEVAALDQAFAQLQERTGNQRLLQTARGEELTFHRHGRQLAGDTSIGGWKENANQIHLTDQTFASPEQAQQIVLHEIGHNWDDPEEHELAADFRAVSGWQPAADASDDQITSTDGHWVYDTDAVFARDYGRFNPTEDFATSFAAYFLHQDGSAIDGLADKFAVIDTMLNQLATEHVLTTPDLSTLDPDSGQVQAWERLTGGWVTGIWRGGW